MSVIAFLGRLPSTNTRIAVTLVCVFGTAVRYWGWGPPDGWEAWLTFLGVMSGLDGAQFLAKRKTQHTEAKPDAA